MAEIELRASISAINTACCNSLSIYSSLVGSASARPIWQRAARQLSAGGVMSAILMAGLAIDESLGHRRRSQASVAKAPRGSCQAARTGTTRVSCSATTQTFKLTSYGSKRSRTIKFVNSTNAVGSEVTFPRTIAQDLGAASAVHRHELSEANNRAVRYVRRARGSRAQQCDFVEQAEDHPPTKGRAAVRSSAATSAKKGADETGERRGRSASGIGGSRGLLFT